MKCSELHSGRKFKGMEKAFLRGRSVASVSRFFNVFNFSAHLQSSFSVWEQLFGESGPPVTRNRGLHRKDPLGISIQIVTIVGCKSDYLLSYILILIQERIIGPLSDNIHYLFQQQMANGFLVSIQKQLFQLLAARFYIPVHRKLLESPLAKWG